MEAILWQVILTVQEKYHQDQEQDGDNDRMTDARLAKDIRWMLDHERS